jgi:uncharacterized protein YhhL (DUF1145 family)
MRELLGNAIRHPALSRGSILLWGVLEFVALQRSHLGSRRRQTR